MQDADFCYDADFKMPDMTPILGNAIKNQLKIKQVIKNINARNATEPENVLKRCHLTSFWPIFTAKIDFLKTGFPI